MPTHLCSIFDKTETSLEPQFQLSGDTAGHFLLVGEKHRSGDSFLYGTLSAENEKEEDQLLIRCNCFTLLNKDVTRWFTPSLLHGPWVALRGCFTLQQSGPGDRLQLPKPHCLAGRARGYRPFCCPHADVHQGVLGSRLTIHALGTPSEPRSPVHLTAGALRGCQHLTPEPAASSRQGSALWPRTCAVLSGRPPLRSPTGFHADLTGLACCDKYICRGQGRAEGTQTVRERQTRRQSARRWHESIIRTRPARSQARWDHEHPNHSQGRALEDSWHPDTLKTGVNEVGISPRGWQSLHCVRTARFPDLHIRGGNAASSQEKPLLPLARYSWEEPLSWRRNEQPNSTDLSAFNYSWSVVQIFCCPSCIVLPKTQKPATVQDFYPSKIIITLQPY